MEELFENEVKSLSQLNHENVVKLVVHGKARFAMASNANQDS